MQSLDNFLNEVQILLEAQNKKVVKLIRVSINGELKKSCGTISKVFYYVMEFAENGELFKTLQICPGLPEPIARHYFVSLIKGE